VAGFPILTDNHVRQPIIAGLRARNWDVVRAVDVLGERNDDGDLLTWAAQGGRVLLTNDGGIHAIAARWLNEGRPFRMVYWRAERHREMSDGDLIRALEKLAANADAFAYRIEYVKPER
jgi:Domain of unknown function (DUF5615)